MGDDGSEVMSDALAAMQSARDDMARSFGERAPGQEHRAWVEHDTLRGLDPSARDWRNALSYCGLAELDVDDPALPAQLRRLLRPKTPWYGDLVPEVFAIRREHRTGQPAPWTLQAAIAEALDGLEAQPFVVCIGGLLVENVPSHPRLRLWRRDLAERLKAAEDRRDQAESLLKQIRKAARKLGETARDGAAEAAERTRAAEQRQITRIRKLDDKLAARLTELDARLDEVRSRARLEHLRDEARALAGSPADDAPERIAAELEVDLGTLVTEVMDLRRDLDQEAARYAARSEIASVER